MRKGLWILLEHLWHGWLAFGLVGASAACTAPVKDIAATGNFPSQPVWSLKAGERILSLSSSSDKVFVDTTRKIYALDAKDGRVLWQADLANQQSHPPTVCGDVLVTPTQETSLAALSLNTGMVLWMDTESRHSLAKITSITCTRNIAVVARWSGEVVNYQLHTGNVLWSFLADDRWNVDVDIVGNVVLIATYSGIRALDLDTGTQSFHLDSVEMAGPLLMLGNDLYVISFRNPGYELVRFNNNGNEKHKIELPPNIHSDTMLYADGMLYFTTDGGVIAVTLENGNILWKNEGFGGLSGLTQQKPVVLGNKLYVRDATRLHVLDAYTGLYLGSLALNGSLAWDLFTIPYPAPIVVDQKLLVVTFGEDTVQAYQP